ncbi:glycosyltransferase family 4 protein [Marinobacter bryozoorum]|jgi:glycosyltransferase involved in cell wall biosynthesis|uniref:glycosyltransferase family 4 protein n=1 Tax=Marinobacter bryozoorum TaxID=256324 RepID=UPI002004F132|nr:glycosyltransferase family 1 protein [Marinobacter bryozoorum]MCK7545793.1 glycosyltransferase family 4 protein [Marinobacter bryozoorum]
MHQIDAPMTGGKPGAEDLRFIAGGYQGVLDRAFPQAEGGSLLLVDVSSIVRFDPGTGIQRVVRRVLQELMTSTELPFRVEPVYEYQGRYYFARRFGHRILGLSLPDQARRWRPDALVEPQEGDVFLGLDWAQPMVKSAEQTLTGWRSAGVSLHFVVYDLLPLQLPQYFPRRFGREMEEWLSRIAGLADSLQCISQSVASEVSASLDALGFSQAGPVVDSFPLGADFLNAARVPGEPVPGLTLGEDDRLVCLMVGTLDPRKGYAQALAAFEVLWQERAPVRLVIVGRPGAMNARLAARLRRHPQSRGDAPALAWLESAPDGQLAWLYQKADFLLAASEGEGFGLPLAEAVAYGVPVLARGLPVFREVLGSNAEYFEGGDAASLADSIGSYIDRLSAGEIPEPEAPDIRSWHDCARILAGNLSAFVAKPAGKV